MKAFIFGTFNPATNAHVNMGIAAKKALVDAGHPDVGIIYIPTGDEYIKNWKGYREGSVMPGDIRTQLLSGAVKEYGFSVSGVEVAGIMDGKTYNTLEHFRKKYPDDEFVLCLGMDNIPQLPKWYKWKELLARTGLLVFNRIPMQAEMKVVLSKTCSCQFVELPPGSSEISSTRVRQCYLENDMETLKTLVPENIFRYLYHTRDVYKN